MSQSVPPVVRPPRVFISYSHDSPTFKQLIRSFSDRLRQHGVEAWIDQYVNLNTAGWPRWMEEQVREADFVLMVCTEPYLRRVELREEAGKGKGAIWEAGLIYNLLYGSYGLNEKVLPIKFSAHSPATIPLVLQGSTFYEVDTEAGYERLLRVLFDQPSAPPPPLGAMPELSPKGVPDFNSFMQPASEPPASEQPPPPVATPPPSSTDPTQEIRQFIRQDRLRDAFERLEEVMQVRQHYRLEEIPGYLARLTRLDKQVRMGVIDTASENQERNRLRLAASELVSDL